MTSPDHFQHLYRFNPRTRWAYCVYAVLMLVLAAACAWGEPPHDWGQGPRPIMVNAARGLTPTNPVPVKAVVPGPHSDMEPIVPVQPPVTNTFRITLAWTDPNPTGTIDHYLVNLSDTNGPMRTMTVPAPATSNQIFYLSVTNHYTLTVQAVDMQGLASDLSEKLEWRPKIVSGAIVSILAGPTRSTATNVPGSQQSANPGYYRVIPGTIVLASSPSMSGPWTSVPAPLPLKLPVVGLGYWAAIIATNNIAQIKASETPMP